MLLRRAAWVYCWCLCLAISTRSLRFFFVVRITPARLLSYSYEVGLTNSDGLFSSSDDAGEWVPFRKMLFLVDWSIWELKMDFELLNPDLVFSVRSPLLWLSASSSCSDLTKLTSSCSCSLDSFSDDKRTPPTSSLFEFSTLFGSYKESRVGF